MQGEDSKQQRRQHKKSLLTNLNRQKPSLSRLHHKQPNTPTNTQSLQRRRPWRVLPIPIQVAQVARREEARRGREDADAAPTDGGTFRRSFISKAPRRDF